MTRVKICGIKEEAHALAAAKAGADFIGLVFAPSRRQITPTQAKKIATKVKESGHTTEVVGLFVNESAETVNEMADLCGLDRVQLSGDESWEYCLEINRPIFKVIRVRRSQSAQEIVDILADGLRVLDEKQFILSLDAYVKGKHGGTGMKINWTQARPVAEQFPIIIAGGLTPENVGRAIEQAAPWGVDVSSGVEVNGVKHTARIRAFINAVRRADDKRR
jgi:phosphoribosylanthranilate isomerase